MTVGYFVRYEGQSNEPEKFLDYYAKTHGQFMRAYPGIRSAILHTPVAWHDPLPINAGSSFLLGEFHFDSPESLDAALASEARVRAREDAARFPHFDGKVTHQAFRRAVLF